MGDEGTTSSGGISEREYYEKRVELAYRRHVAGDVTVADLQNRLRFEFENRYGASAYSAHIRQCAATYS